MAVGKEVEDGALAPHIVFQRQFMVPTRATQYTTNVIARSVATKQSPMWRGRRSLRLRLAMTSFLVVERSGVACGEQGRTKESPALASRSAGWSWPIKTLGNAR
jgi:hypothetical protein